MDESAFAALAALPAKQVWDGILARCVDGERITLGVVELGPGTLAAEHRHENEQLGIVLAGSLTFRVADETRELGPGDTWRIPANTPHEARAGADGAVVIDVFAPPRADWTAREPIEPQPPLWP